VSTPADVSQLSVRNYVAKDAKVGKGNMQMSQKGAARTASDNKKQCVWGRKKLRLLKKIGLPASACFLDIPAHRWLRKPG